MSKKSYIRLSGGDRVFNVLMYVIMAFILVVCAYPLYFVVIASFSDPAQVNIGKVILLPKDIMFDGYISIFTNAKIWIAYKNTILYTVVGTIVNVYLTLTAAFPLSRRELLGRKTIMKLLTFTMFFSGGMIPNYLLVLNLNLKNTIWAMVLPTAVSVWNLIIARSYFMSTIPDELIEAAEIDGCGSLRFFFTMALPLSKALTAVMVLFYAVAHWNEFFNAMLYLDKSSMHPLQIVLRDLLLVNQGVDSSMLADAEEMQLRQKLADLLKYGAVVVTTLPVLAIYPFIQKYFVKGIMVGAVKG